MSEERNLKKMQKIKIKQKYFFPGSDIRMLGKEILQTPSLVLLYDELSGACYGFGFTPEATVEELKKVRNAFLEYIRNALPNFEIRYSEYSYPAHGYPAHGRIVKYIFRVAGKEEVIIAPVITEDAQRVTYPSLASDIEFLARVAGFVDYYQYHKISLHIEEEVWGEEVEA